MCAHVVFAYSLFYWEFNILSKGQNYCHKEIWFLCSFNQLQQNNDFCYLSHKILPTKNNVLFVIYFACPIFNKDFFFIGNFPILINKKEKNKNKKKVVKTKGLEKNPWTFSWVGLLIFPNNKSHLIWKNIFHLSIFYATFYFIFILLVILTSILIIVVLVQHWRFSFLMHMFVLHSKIIDHHPGIFFFFSYFYNKNTISWFTDPSTEISSKANWMKIKKTKFKWMLSLPLTPNKRVWLRGRWEWTTKWLPCWDCLSPTSIPLSPLFVFYCSPFLLFYNSPQHT